MTNKGISDMLTSVYDIKDLNETVQVTHVDGSSGSRFELMLDKTANQWNNGTS